MASERTPKGPPQVMTHTRNPVRRFFHILISLLGWALFAWFWYTVFALPLDRRAYPTFLILLVFLAGIILVNALWVNFNRGIYRTRGRRTRVREVEFAGVADQLGRTLEGADWDRLRGEAWVRVDLDAIQGVKRYTGVSLARGGHGDSGEGR